MALLGLLFSIPKTVIAEPTLQETKPYDILPDVLYQTTTSTPNSATASSTTEKAAQEKRPGGKTDTGKKEGTLITSQERISPEALRQYLGESPLAQYSEKILESPYWATIIGICTIEQYNCQRAPKDTYNYWGMLSKGKVIKYPSQEAAIDAVHNLLDKAYNNGRDTIDELNGWYCYNANYPGGKCPSWTRVVTETKLKLEALNETQNSYSESNTDDTRM